MSGGRARLRCLAAAIAPALESIGRECTASRSAKITGLDLDRFTEELLPARDDDWVVHRRARLEGTFLDALVEAARGRE